MQLAIQQSLIKSVPYFLTAPFVTSRGKMAKLEDSMLDGPTGTESRNGAHRLHFEKENQPYKNVEAFTVSAGRREEKNV
jgi:hypothetical protein